MDARPAVERVLFVHAHPDDESIVTGATIAALTDRGASVMVLTCTRGELGEVIPADLQYLARRPDELARHREGELSRALAILGVTEHRYLGQAGARWNEQEPRRYRDSGMQWEAGVPQPLEPLAADSFCAADMQEVISDLAVAIAEFRADIVVSYDEFGGYGHPDHIRAHQAAVQAAHALGVPFYAIEPAIESAGGTAAETQDKGETAGRSEPGILQVDAAGTLIDRKRAAMAAHRSQLVVMGDRFALAGRGGADEPITTVERFRRRTDAPFTGFIQLAEFTRQRLGIKILISAAALLIGAAVGVVATINHQASVTVFRVPVWYGLILAVLAVTALLVGLRLVADSRWVAALAAGGILMADAVLSLPGAGGSVLVPANPAGYLWIFAPVVIGAVVLGWPRLPAVPDRIDLVEN